MPEFHETHDQLSFDEPLAEFSFDQVPAEREYNTDPYFSEGIVPTEDRIPGQRDPSDPLAFPDEYVQSQQWPDESEAFEPSTDRGGDVPPVEPPHDSGPAAADNPDFEPRLQPGHIQQYGFDEGWREAEETTPAAIDRIDPDDMIGNVSTTHAEAVGSARHETPPIDVPTDNFIIARPSEASDSTLSLTAATAEDNLVVTYRSPVTQEAVMMNIGDASFLEASKEMTKGILNGMPVFRDSSTQVYIIGDIQNREAVGGAQTTAENYTELLSRVAQDLAPEVIHATEGSTVSLDAVTGNIIVRDASGRQTYPPEQA